MHCGNNRNLSIYPIDETRAFLCNVDNNLHNDVDGYSNSSQSIRAYYHNQRQEVVCSVTARIPTHSFLLCHCIINHQSSIMLTSKGTLSAVLAASVGSAACFGVTSAFTAAGGRPTTTRSSSLPSQLGATVDPTVVTKKEYQDICGVDFDDSTLASRLAKTAYLYPKHVEVIDDFAPLVDKMVDEIVST